MARTGGGAPFPPPLPALLNNPPRAKSFSHSGQSEAHRKPDTGGPKCPSWSERHSTGGIQNVSGGSVYVVWCTDIGRHGFV